MTINFCVLQQAVMDYFYIEEEFRKFLRTWVPGWWPNKSAQEREDYTKHSERSSKAMETVSRMCKMIGADYDACMALFKSIQRYEKHNGKYDRNIHISCIENEKIYEYILKSKETPYYQNTGRRIYA